MLNVIVRFLIILFPSIQTRKRVSLFLQQFAMSCLVLEHGYYTACSGKEDIWLISNGSCMPRDVNLLAQRSKVLASLILFFLVVFWVGV